MADLKSQLAGLATRLEQINKKIDPQQSERQIRELETQTMHADFWSDPAAAQSVMKRLSALRQDQEQIAVLRKELEDNLGLVDLVEAIKYLDDSIGLIVIGQGPLEKTLKLRVKNLNLENRIEFVGEVANERLPDYLAAADIFVRPSLSEGLGIAFIEAMAMGVPVIGTPVGGILDLIKNQETGLLCEVGNPKDIAAKIQTILNDDILKQRLTHGRFI